MLSRLVARIIERIDEIDGDADLEEDNEDAGVEDDPLGIDPEQDYCLAHEDHGTWGMLTPAQKQEVRRVKLAAKALRKPSNVLARNEGG
ncbi:MAG: hypothetical protein ABR588_05925 [Sphingomicrobium sp.]|nr:hypothetical protein [Sphingomonadales bacterium]